MKAPIDSSRRHRSQVVCATTARRAVHRPATQDTTGRSRAASWNAHSACADAPTASLPGASFVDHHIAQFGREAPNAESITS